MARVLVGNRALHLRMSLPRLRVVTWRLG